MFGSENIKIDSLSVESKIDESDTLYCPGSELSPKLSQLTETQQTSFFQKPESRSNSDQVPNIRFRTIHPPDFNILKSLHNSIFPIRYETGFFKNVVFHRGILSWGAVDSQSPEKLVGFVTAKCMSEAEALDPDLLGEKVGTKDRELMYILTLGVSKPYRHNGIASKLVDKVLRFAESRPQIHAVYLHVIDYNVAAREFYLKSNFKLVKKIQNFYFINNNHYDAFLFVYYINGGHPPRLMIDLVTASTLWFRTLYNIIRERFLCEQLTDKDKIGEGSWTSLVHTFFSRFKPDAQNKIPEPKDNESIV